MTDRFPWLVLGTDPRHPKRIIRVYRDGDTQKWRVRTFTAGNPQTEQVTAMSVPFQAAAAASEGTAIEPAIPRLPSFIPEPLVTARAAVGKPYDYGGVMTRPGTYDEELVLWAAGTTGTVLVVATRHVPDVLVPKALERIPVGVPLEHMTDAVLATVPWRGQVHRWAPPAKNGNHEQLEAGASTTTSKKSRWRAIGR